MFDVRATGAPKLFILLAMKIAASAPSECPMIMIGLCRFFADGQPPPRALHNPDDHGVATLNELLVENIEPGGKNAR